MTSALPNIYIVAGVVSLIFVIGKFVEMRFVEKESKPLKFLFRDALVVYFSVIIGNFIMVQLNPVIHGGSGGAPQTPAVFMDNPEF